MRIEAQPRNIFLVQCYSPTAEKHDERETFYNHLNEVIKKKKSEEILMVLGDFNAKVGLGRIDNIVGPFGLGEMNDAGEDFVSFCSENSLTICNTWFEQKVSARHTWTSPGGNTKNQIDYICINQRYRNAILNAKARPGADCSSDHNPVIITMRVKLKKLKQPKKKLLWNDDKYKQPIVKQQFSYTFLEEIDKKKPFEDHEKWSAYKEALKAAAEKVIGKKTSQAKQKWMTQDILDLMEERKRYKTITTVESQQKYRELKRKVRDLCRKRKDEFINNECEEAERLEKFNSSQFHKKLKSLTPKSNKVSHCLLDAEGNELFDGMEISARWKEYCETLYEDRNRSTQLEVRQIEEDQIPQFTTEDIGKIIKELKNNKSVGPDEIPAEFLKLLNEEGIQHITEIINTIYKNGIIPNDFAESTFIPIPKVNKAQNCSDFRTISLISHTSKILLILIKQRISDIIERNLSETQIGFRNGKGCRDAITGLRILLGKSLEMQNGVYLAFIDFQKAFDNVLHDKLRIILEKINIPRAELRLIESLYWNQRGKIKTQQGTSEGFAIKKGIRQGCIISPMLFNLYVEQIISESIGDEKDGFKMNGRVLNNIRYADDTLLIATSKEELEKLLRKVMIICEKYGMKMNMKKTKVMLVAKGETELERRLNIKMGSETLEQVTSYQYLGALIHNDGRCIKEIKKRIGMGKSAFWVHKEMMRRNISKGTKLRLLKTYVYSVMSYGCESWTLDETTSKRITSFENWCYRRMLKISWKDKVTNTEVLRRIGKRKFELLKIVKQRKLAYAGHVMRESSGRLLTEIMDGKIDGRRAQGRQRRKWVDDIKEWTKLPTYGKVKRLAEDRVKWKEIIHNI
uniref:Craniofacial development protein 2 n=1 Tax=Cacopsylla melanoneura TaxID=428564 RepID=A0A8D9FJ87_9HEMI